MRACDVALTDAYLSLSVTGTPADLIGMGHRVGRLRVGHDADVVIWNAHPLQLGAVPVQVYIDGIPQLESPHVVPRPASAQVEAPSADYSSERQEVISSHGDPDLAPVARVPSVLFVNVGSVVARQNGELKEIYTSKGLVGGDEEGKVVIRDGAIVCVGSCKELLAATGETATTPVVDLKGGSITPG